jgi:hypothetical protein
MKTKINPIFGLLLISALILLAGCEYEGPTAMYNQPYRQTDRPIINSIDPAEAVGGVNLITVTGENFSETYDSNCVYVGKNYIENGKEKYASEKVEIVDFSPTSITFRRPNIFSDSAVIKVVSYQAHVFDSLYPYRITEPYEVFGGFTITGNQLDAVAVDRDENVYVVQRNLPRMVYKITPDGERTELGDQGTNITDAMLAPDGNLVLLTGRTAILKMNISTGVAEDWATSEKRVKFGDFDAFGDLITGGTNTGLFVLAPDMSETEVDDYSKFDIYDVRVYNGAVYVLAKNTKPDTLNPVLAPEFGVWKNMTASDPGGFGEKELVLDWGDTGIYANSTVYDMTFTSNGKLIVATDYTDPVFLYDLESGAKDVFYKSIIPSSVIQTVWGQGNYLYMIQYSAESSLYDLIRVDMGAPGAPYYGR